MSFGVSPVNYSDSDSDVCPKFASLVRARDKFSLLVHPPGDVFGMSFIMVLVFVLFLFVVCANKIYILLPLFLCTSQF